MKKSTFITLSLALLFILSCKVKKQTVTNDRLKTQSSSQLSTENQKTANIIRQVLDSSKTTKKDSAFVSIVEKEEVEYDYPNPAAGLPSKIIHHIKKTTRFQNGENIIDQKNIKSVATTDLKNVDKKSNEQKTASKETQHSIFSITSSSTYWVWIVGLSILLCVVAIYLIKRLNLISILKSLVTKIV